jgi:hypothetical protein
MHGWRNGPWVETHGYHQRSLRDGCAGCRLFALQNHTSPLDFAQPGRFAFDNAWQITKLESDLNAN